jgi:hypothetical protein
MMSRADHESLPPTKPALNKGDCLRLHDFYDENVCFCWRYKKMGYQETTELFGLWDRVTIPVCRLGV